MTGTISQNPNEMTWGEYISENLSRMPADAPARKTLQQFYDTQIKGKLENTYINKASSTLKDMFAKSSGIKFGELQAQPNQTPMEEPEKVKEAKQSFVGSDPKKVTNKVVSEQVDNITNFDEGTAAGQGKNTPAAKQAQKAIRDSRKLVNEVKQEGVADIPVTDSTSDGWVDEPPPPTGNSDGGKGDGNSTPPPTPEEKKRDSLNKLLLADILMTGVRNALHYRPAFRTAYGEDIEGRDFGTEKSLAMKLAEENMKRGLERANQRKDTQSQNEAEIEATKRKGSDKNYLKSKQNVGLASGTQTTSTSETNVRPWGTTTESSTGTTKLNLDRNLNNINTSN